MLVTGTPLIVLGTTMGPAGPTYEVIAPEILSNPKYIAGVGSAASITRTSSVSNPQGEVSAPGALDPLSPPSNCARNDCRSRLPRVRRRFGIPLSNRSRRLDQNVLRAAMKKPLCLKLLVHLNRTFSNVLRMTRRESLRLQPFFDFFRQNKLDLSILETTIRSSIVDSPNS
jgi:hypothetical protein